MKILPNNLKPYVGFKFIYLKCWYIIIEDINDTYWLCNFTLDDNIELSINESHFGKSYLNDLLKSGKAKRVG